jgi:RNA polymerase sigma-54 factor
VPVTRTTLAESLLEQLHFLELSKDDLTLAEFLIGSLDDRGWLATALEDVAQATGRTLADCECVLKVIQALEPVGVGARDLRECLLIQLRSRGETDTLAWRLIHDQFDNLVNRRFPEIARQLKCSAEEVQAAADVVATLNPRPGLEVSSEDPKYVVPDLVVERVDDEYVVMLNDRNVPRLRISSAYESVLREKKKAEKNSDAGRPASTSRQAELGAVVDPDNRAAPPHDDQGDELHHREQRDFFDKGIAFLRPLTLQQVARQIDMHESTVSRVCSGKYVQTPRGVFELKFFFSSGLETEDGEDVSARARKDVIKTLIEEEEKTEPLSDQRIAELLAPARPAHRATDGGEVSRAVEHPAGTVPPAGGLTTSHAERGRPDAGTHGRTPPRGGHARHDDRSSL